MAEVIDFSILDKNAKNVNQEEDNDKKPVEVKKGLSWTCLLGLFVLILLIILESVLPRIFGSLGMTLIFIIATIPTFFTGRKVKPHMVVKDGVYKSFSAMALLAGVGMFVEVLTWIGARGWFVANALSLPSILQYVAIAVTLPSWLW